MTAFRILIADDHEVVRQGLRSMLETHPGWEVCGEAVDGREALRQVELLNPDLVILDIGMPNLNGLDAAREQIRLTVIHEVGHYFGMDENQLKDV